MSAWLHFSQLSLAQHHIAATSLVRAVRVTRQSWGLSAAVDLRAPALAVGHAEVVGTGGRRVEYHIAVAGAVWAVRVTRQSVEVSGELG